ncbi:uncharacterized protein LOC126817865 [Patella vulgata]|uniref:uncharacterized protein LOC126817865 n=1 Tax=Patella vulgata TaxID=6465 RepID=UPI002180406A|nr:uncharacterized protein LOC126817865 [Patella vulgata]
MQIGLKKKLTALSKEKDRGDIVHWIKSVSNHLYWVAASTLSADGQLMLEKWLSVQNHIQNVHQGHGDLFTICSHGELVGSERKKLWLKPGTKLCERFQDVVSSRQMKKDIPMLSTGQQTSCLESYHGVFNHFAPKMIGFSYHGQLCRLLLAVMYFNENTNREQFINQNGEAGFFTMGRNIENP